MSPTGFNMHESQLDPIWRRLYLLEFEAESAVSPKIAVDGDETRWRVRLARRVQTEQNWSAGRRRILYIDDKRFCAASSAAFDERHIVLGHRNGTVRFLDASGLQIGADLDVSCGHLGGVNDLAINTQLSPPLLVTVGCMWADDPKTLKVWNFSTRQLLFELLGGDSNIALGGHTLVTGSRDLELLVYDARIGQMLQRIKLPADRCGPSDDRVTALDVDWQTQRAVLTMRMDGRMMLVDLRTEQVLQTVVLIATENFHTRLIGCLSNVAFSSLGDSAIFTRFADAVVVWKFADNSLKQLCPRDERNHPCASRRLGHFVVATERGVLLVEQSRDNHQRLYRNGRDLASSIRCLRLQWDRLLLLNDFAPLTICDFTPALPK